MGQIILSSDTISSLSVSAWSLKLNIHALLVYNSLYQPRFSQAHVTVDWCYISMGLLR